MDKVTAYIKGNWGKTFQLADVLMGDVKIKHPYVPPCATEHYTNLYYCDTHFINIGILLDGNLVQARNNIDNIATFVNALGFMLNTNIILGRSQPPLFTAVVYGYYKFMGDIGILTAYIDVICKEYEFWETKRKNALGLSAYGTHGSREEALTNYRAHHCRVLASSENEEEQYRIGKDILTIAESGLDFNVRFKTKESKIDAHKLSHLDLGCIIFDTENKATDMMEILNRQEEAKTFRDNAKKRKERINKHYLTEESIYLDYSMETGGHSSILSATSLYPYTFGVSNDKTAPLRS